MSVSNNSVARGGAKKKKAKRGEKLVFSTPALFVRGGIDF